MMKRLAFEMGFTHYDEPPPDRIDDLEALRMADRFRFANRLAAWIEVDDSDGTPVDAGYNGGTLMGSTTVLALGACEAPLPGLRHAAAPASRLSGATAGSASSRPAAAAPACPRPAG